jgi:hypothetical protein
LRLAYPEGRRRLPSSFQLPQCPTGFDISSKTLQLEPEIQRVALKNNALRPGKRYDRYPVGLFSH